MIYSIKRILLFLLLLLPVTGLLYAQEILLPVSGNPVAAAFYHAHPAPKKTATADTLELPFIDDFSNSIVEPNPHLWSDNFAFINNTYPVFPVTAGVATLDAYNFDGTEYTHAGTNPYVADYLTSQPVNLDLSPGDSVYLSFFFQPKGLGEMPDARDSLCLEFFNPGPDSWGRIWTVPGDSLQPFRQVMIPVIDTSYLKKGFRFRFFNYASQTENNDYPDLRSNVDHWHIDYVYLNKGRNFADTILRDVAFITPLRSLLKNYESIPWRHLKTAYATQISAFIPAIIMNHDTITRNVTKALEITDISTGFVYKAIPVANDLEAGDSINYLYGYNYPFDFESGRQTASFNVRAILKTDVFDFKPNDTLNYNQVFDNYYALDDGTAEAGYGLRGQGTRNASVAVKYESFVADSLRAIDMYFNQVIDSLNLQYYFYLCVWDDNGGKPGNLIYNKLGEKIRYSGKINKFVRYPLDYPVPVSGIFYVGWTKTVDKVSNIGMDLNRNHSSDIFYNTGNGWVNSQFKGSLMVRPYMSPEPLTGTGSIKDPLATKEAFTVFPVPADQYLYFQSDSPHLADCKLSLFDITGRLLGEYDPTSVRSIFTGDYKAGVYFVVLSNSLTGRHSTRKVIINH